MSEAIPPIIHAYKQWCGQTLCMGDRTPQLTYSTTRPDRVTCEECNKLIDGEYSRLADLRARLAHEQRDEPQQRYESHDEATGIAKSGPID